LGLAQGFSAVLAIIVAMLAFVAERTVKRYRARDASYRLNLILLIGLSVASVIVGGLTWSTWSLADPGVHLLFGWCADVWLAIVFGGTLLAASGCGVVATIALLRFSRAGRGANSWEP